MAMIARPPMWLLIGISSAGPFALNVFVPSLPRLAEHFATDYGTAQLALTYFLLGVAAGQLVYGPLSDRYGRRPVLLAGLSLGVLGSLLCLFAPTIDWLLAGRVAQAFGACSGLVLARAIVRDLYGRDEAASALGYVTMGMALMPMVAPTIGGLIDQTYGWRTSFVAILAFLGAVTLAAWWRGVETNASRGRELAFGGLARGWTALLRSRAFMGYTLSMTCNTIIFFGFLASAPYLMVTVLDRPPAEYGYWFAFSAGAYVLGNYATARWSKTIGLDRMARIGNLLGLAPAAFGLLWALSFELHPIGFFLPVMLMGFTHGFAQPNLIAGAVSVNPSLAGSASGLLGFVQMTLGALATYIMGHAQDGTMLPLAILIAACALGAVLFHGWARP
jgi:MFS transporter, DHA1 family, multidrug resistance protein